MKHIAMSSPLEGPRRLGAPIQVTLVATAEGRCTVACVWCLTVAGLGALGHGLVAALSVGVLAVAGGSALVRRERNE